MTARLASEMLVTALIRRAQAEGGSAAVLAKGDGQAGGVIVILAQRGAIAGVFERACDFDDQAEWREIPIKHLESNDKETGYVARRRAVDGDLWAIELDIADSKRFAAEMSAMG